MNKSIDMLKLMKDCTARIQFRMSLMKEKNYIIGDEVKKLRDKLWMISLKVDNFSIGDFSFD